MAKSLQISSFLLTLLILTSALSFSLITAKKPKSRDGYSRVLSPATLRLKKEKLSHLRFYFHDIVAGPNPTAVQIVRPPSTNLSSTLSILGRNAVWSPVREMPVIGGSGVFRFARGYAQARTSGPGSST
ncbi:unnamed protein product [Linum tenue]|uniref:Dirigent protein n=1 Tax=Linum tenue TaxID=586396 RepID=A0AAV0IYA9_9ROSI|nr:unnamed protein product [Linum tenue]